MNQLQKMEVARKNLTEQLDKLLNLPEEEKDKDIKKYNTAIESITKLLNALNQMLEVPDKAAQTEKTSCTGECCHPACQCNVAPYVFFETEYTVPYDFEWYPNVWNSGYFTEFGMVANPNYLHVIPEVCYKENVTVSNPCDGEPIEGCKAQINALRVVGCIPYAVEVMGLINPENFHINVGNEVVHPVVSPSRFDCAQVDNIIKYTADCTYQPDLQVDLVGIYAFWHNDGPEYEVMILGLFEIRV